MLFIQLLEKGHVQSLAVLAHGSGETCCGFFHVVIKKTKKLWPNNNGFQCSDEKMSVIWQDR